MKKFKKVVAAAVLASAVSFGANPVESPPDLMKFFKTFFGDGKLSYKSFERSNCTYIYDNLTFVRGEFIIKNGTQIFLPKEEIKIKELKLTKTDSLLVADIQDTSVSTKANEIE